MHGFGSSQTRLTRMNNPQHKPPRCSVHQLFKVSSQLRRGSRTGVGPCRRKAGQSRTYRNYPQKKTHHSVPSVKTTSKVEFLNRLGGSKKGCVLCTKFHFVSNFLGSRDDVSRGGPVESCLCRCRRCGTLPPLPPVKIVYSPNDCTTGNE